MFLASVLKLILASIIDLVKIILVALLILVVAVEFE